MKYITDKQENYTIMTIKEKMINSMIAPTLKSEFIFLKNEGVKNLVLDLYDVEYIDSSGLSAILTANRLWKNDGSFCIINIVHSMVNKLVMISRLDSILAIFSDLEEALEYVKEMTSELTDDE